MRTILVGLTCVALCGCASVPTRCYKSASLAAAIGTAGGYVTARQASGETRYVESWVNHSGDIFNTIKSRPSGRIYENREAIAIGTGLVVGAISIATCVKN